MTDRAIESAIDNTIQSRATQDVFLGSRVLQILVQAGDLLPPWWSSNRDTQLRKLWKMSDHLSGAVYTMQSKMTSIPFKVVASDASNPAQVRMAENFENLIRSSAEFGDGWAAFYGRWVEDLLTQDNGAFAEIIGDGPISGPLMGSPISIAHLDASKCSRTGNAEFPVVFMDDSGKYYKLHYTRVIYSSQMPSPNSSMNGVGFCAISRASNVAQNLMDIIRYKQEKLGSRPQTGIMVTKGGLDPEDVDSAFAIADMKLSNMEHQRFGRIAVVGHRSLPDAELQMVELSGLPDGFDEQTTTVLGMATIALAFGVDARELFPAMSAGATRADALLSHLKQRGKGPGQILETTESLFNQKFLPSTLRLVFDFQDDAEDRQSAEIQRLRSQRRFDDMGQKVTDPHVERQIMVRKGELTPMQFREIELRNGLLENGDPVLTLFWSTVSPFTEILGPIRESAADLLDVSANSPENVLSKIAKQKGMALDALASTTKDKERWKLQQSIAALENLKELYDEAAMIEKEEERAEEAMEAGARTPDRRLRTTNPSRPTEKDGSTNSSDTIRSSPEDNSAKELNELIQHPFWGSFFVD